MFWLYILISKIYIYHCYYISLVFHEIISIDKAFLCRNDIDLLCMYVFRKGKSGRQEGCGTWSQHLRVPATYVFLAERERLRWLVCRLLWQKQEERHKQTNSERWLVVIRKSQHFRWNQTFMRIHVIVSQKWPSLQ